MLGCELKLNETEIMIASRSHSGADLSNSGRLPTRLQLATFEAKLSSRALLPKPGAACRAINDGFAALNVAKHLDINSNESALA